MPTHFCCNIGSYDCYVPIIMFGMTNDNKLINVDRCLTPELCYLWNEGIKTIGCCCGHREVDGYIQVDPNYVDKMRELGYEQLQEKVDYEGNVMGSWCFKPKTKLPKLEYVDDIIKDIIAKLNADRQGDDFATI